MKQYETAIDVNGQEFKLQFGKLAHAATTSVFASMGETCVMVALTIGREKNDLDYFPLQIVYDEKLYAGGIIKGSRWVKREGKPTDDAILTGRVIDRSVRPFFPKSYRREVQIVITLMSVDKVNDPEVLATNAVSAALHVSPAPWKGPIAATRIACMKGDAPEVKYIINPDEQTKPDFSMDLFVTSNNDKVVMLEAAASEVSDEVVKEGIKVAKIQNLKLIKFINSLREKIGMEKEVIEEKAVSDDLRKLLSGSYNQELKDILEYKLAREYDDGSMTREVIKKILEKEEVEYVEKDFESAIDYLTKEMIRTNTTTTGKRVDGRGIDDIRELGAEVGILPRTHGTGLFHRGDTQVLSVATLGSPGLEQLIEGPEGQEKKRYIHHYNFPPYSVGEVGRVGFPSRREIGHGALAEKAILPVLPTKEEFPYVIRVVSEVLTSNGSTSMASTCGSSLALMDAGVPIKRPVAGIAMGIMSKSDDEYVILTDIMGIEDFSGEMDFKVTGTTEGITAIQLDVKNMGLTDVMIDEILDRAKKARLKIIDVMNKAIDAPRVSVSKYAPSIQEVQVDKEDIGTVIGPGGKMIRGIIEQTGTEVNVDDDGRVTVSGVDRAKVEEAVQIIKDLVRSVEIGEEFSGEVKRLMNFGAFVEFLPGKEGLVHVSKMSSGFVKDPADIVKEGDKVKVKVLEVDSQGRINLQMTELPDGTPVVIEESQFQDRPPRRDGNSRGGRSYGSDRRDDRRGPRREEKKRW